MYRILLIEDEPGMLGEVVQLLAEWEGITLIGPVGSEQAVTEVKKSQPDLGLLGWDEAMTGLETLYALIALPVVPAMIVLAAVEHPHLRGAVKAMGVRATLSLSKARTHLRALIDTVRNEFRPTKLVPPSGDLR